MHEIGHLIAMRIKNVPITQVSFGFLNIEILSSKLENDIFIFLSGSLMNFILGLILFITYYFSGTYILKIAFIQNFILAFINLLPINFLDGGKILKIILLKKYDFYKAENILNIISFFFLVPTIFIIIFLILINKVYNFLFLIIVCYIISYIILEK